MKKLFCVVPVFVVMGYVHIGTPIFSINNGFVSTNNQFIDAFDSNVTVLNYSIDTILQYHVGNTVYSVGTGRFSGWDNEPGDFDVIEFSKNGQEQLLFRENEGILKYKNSNSSFINQYSSCADNDYFIDIPLSPSSNALIFMGMTYGADLPRLMIFVLTETDVKLVYYKRIEVDSITITPDTFSMSIISNFTSDNDDVPLTHTIFMNGSALYIKNN